MKKYVLLLTLLYLSPLANALSSYEYMTRFMTYLQYNQQLPEKQDESFLAFIDNDLPLSNRLRNKWLYHLASKKDWTTFLRYYKPVNDLNLQCYYHAANYAQGNTEAAMQAAQEIWLAGHSQPPGCQSLFRLYTSSKQFTSAVITQRIALALNEKNVLLAHYLMKQLKPAHPADEKLLLSIHQSPQKIASLQPGFLHDLFLLYGLKRLVSLNLDKAIQLWKQPTLQRQLNTEQQQAFIAHVALYKAMRNQNDAHHWFAQLKPGYYNETLLDWRIRYVLSRHQWVKVEKLIQQHHDKANPCWQYWLARSLEQQGKKDEAQAIYQTLAQTRHYYGFLASQRHHVKPSFQNELPVTDLKRLKPYQSFITTIETLYSSKQTLEASRLLNDFILELPKEDKSALTYWLANTLEWHGKAVHISSSEDLTNQLALRFPLPFEKTVNTHAKTYSVPPEFIYAIIRQESLFRDDVVSSVGARGLMQLMPATAYLVARLAKIPYGDKAQLFLSPININIGTAYLSTLSKRFKNHPVLMAAAYNAGPKQVNYWLKNHHHSDMDIWIETLPWQETRNYIKNVIAFYAVYQYRLNKKPDLSVFMRPV